MGHSFFCPFAFALIKPVNVGSAPLACARQFAALLILDIHGCFDSICTVNKVYHLCAS